MKAPVRFVVMCVIGLMVVASGMAGGLVHIGRKEIVFKDREGKKIRAIAYVPYDEGDWKRSPMTVIEDSYYYDKVEILFDQYVLVMRTYKGYENTQVTKMTFMDSGGKTVREIPGGGNVFFSPDKRYVLTYRWIEGDGDDHAVVYSNAGKRLKVVPFEKGVPSAWMKYRFESDDVLVFDVEYPGKKTEKRKTRRYTAKLPKI